MRRSGPRGTTFGQIRKLKAIIRAGQPVIVFHNHLEEDSRAAMFPSDEDFGVAGLVSFMTYAEDPGLAVEFRVVQLDGELETVVSYGFKGTALADIRRMALEHRSVAARHWDVSRIEAEQDLLDAHLAEEASIDYLRHVCPMDRRHGDTGVQDASGILPLAERSVFHPPSRAMTFV